MWKYYGLRLAYLLLGWLPLGAKYGIALVVGDAAYFARGGTRAAVCDNMRHVMGPDAPEGEIRRAAREVFRNATRYYADLFHVPRLDVERFYREGMELSGEEYLHAAEDSGRGGVVASAHFGNPEMAVQGLAAAGFSIMGLTEPLKPAELSDFTDWLRSCHGHVYRTASFGGVKAAVTRIRAGGLLAILFDRDVTGTGVLLPFFGADVPIPLGAVDIATRTGCDLIPAFSWRLPGRRFRVEIGPPLELERTDDVDEDLRTNTRRLLALFEERLRKDPGQWAVLESIWRDRTTERAVATGALQ